MADLRRTISLLEQTLVSKAIGLDEAKGLLQVLTDYAYALTTLDRFDHGTLLIAESPPQDKETIVKVIVSLINRANA